MGLLDVFKKDKNQIKANEHSVDSDDKRIAQCFFLLLEELDKPVYRSIFIRTLRGRKDKPLIKTDHKLFGCLNDLTYKQLKRCLYYYISLGYISLVSINNKLLIVKNDKSKLLLENIDNLYFKGFTMPEDDEIFFNKYINKKLSKDNINNVNRSIKQNKKANKINYDKVLFSLLMKKRNELANKKDIPGYIVSPNKTIQLIAEAKPKSKEAMLKINGMGEKRYDLYGVYFLDIINEYLNKNKAEEITVDNFEELFSGDQFISRRDMESFYQKYLNKKVTVNKRYIKYMKSLETLNIYRVKYNDAFINKNLEDEKLYLDEILHRVDPAIILDKKQREAVLRDEDFTLVVAGAGAGKTTTVSAKVKYLVDKKNVDPEKILIVSYTNDAVDELRTRINKDLNIPARISTFHKVGYAIIRKTKDIDQMKVAHDGLIYNVIKDYVVEKLKKNENDLRNLILFFGYYIDAPASSESLENFINHFQRNDFTTMKTNLKEMTEQLIDERAAKKETIQHEVLRSLEEVQIANFLFLHNIEYQYEKAYPFNLKGSNKLYTPDFTIQYKGRTIYLEHFGISESGKHTRYSEKELEVYKKNIKDKINLHKNRGTELIYTFSMYNDGKTLLRHLKETLESKGIELKERPLKEVYEAIVQDDSNKYFYKLIFLIKDFISSFKINGFSENDFNELSNKTDSIRNRLFLKICKPIYLHYQTFLLENNYIDFEDMINESKRVLENPESRKLIPDFDYAIIDEYQDISQQRFDLAKALSELTKAKIIAVGDDWQSIFAFAGSRIDLFYKFKTLMGYADYLTIDYTYRNAQEIIDIAGSFIQRNDDQLKKHLKSPKHIEIPITLYEYSDIVYKNEKKGYKGIIHEKAKLCNKIIRQVVKEYGYDKDIALLGRYNFELKHLQDSDFFREGRRGNLVSIKYPKAKILFYTIHGAKGLGFDNVILLNGNDEIFGFPSQIQMDPVLKLVKYDDNSYQYAEERRLFYVALTRTKNKVFILYPKTKPSTFVLELAKDYNLVNHPKEINKKIPLQDRKEKRCPRCGYPLQFKKNNAYGLKLYICSNEPEICGYLTNNLRSGKKSISKCPNCVTGFLIVKHSKKTKNYFFGCTNYNSNGKGCNHIEPIEEQEFV